MADPELDRQMQDFIERGRPFEMRIASGYFALSSDKQLVRKAFDIITEAFTDEEVRLEFLNCLKERRNEPEIQQIALEYLGNPKNGLGRYIANQVFILADRNPFFTKRVRMRVRILRPKNSSSHGENAGQNVLRLNGEVFWTTEPTIGPNHDDIWTVADKPPGSEYVGTEVPRKIDDEFIAP